jgi:hypothetical protein
VIDDRLFDPGPGMKLPSRAMSPDRLRTARRRVLLERGINPATRRPFAHNGETCGSCAHLQVHQHSRRYYKCGLVANTGGPGTDIRLRWPACTLWERPRG